MYERGGREGRELFEEYPDDVEEPKGEKDEEDEESERGTVEEQTGQIGSRTTPKEHVKGEEEQGLEGTRDQSVAKEKWPISGHWPKRNGQVANFTVFPLKLRSWP